MRGRAGGLRPTEATVGRRRAARRVGRPTLPLAVALAFCALLLAAQDPAAKPKVPVLAPPPPNAAPSFSSADLAFLDDLEHRTFRFFWERANPRNGLVPDRWPTKSFSSIAAVGFGLTAYPIGVERGWVTRAEAAERTLTTLRSLWNLPQGDAATGVAGYRGFFYHFLDLETGLRFAHVELSSVDTTLLFGGVLFARGYFDRDNPVEREIRDLATRLYGRVEWDWMRPRPPKIAMGWTPEEGFGADDWNGYNEAMLVYLLALGSPTHPADPAAWAAWVKTYRVVDFQGQRYVDFAPLFGHHYSHLWVDFLGIRDAAVQANGFDYFENSRRATLAQRAWAIANPRGWKGLGRDVWGVSACDGPADVERVFAGEQRRFWTYAGRGVGPRFPIEDGTVAPTAAAGSIAFAPEVVLPALVEMRRRYGEALYGEYGFVDAFNPSFDFDVAVPQGRIVRGLGWFDTDYLGIDQGPIVGMIENYRSGLAWRVMRRDPDLRRGLERAGFTGGWLASTPR